MQNERVGWHIFLGQCWLDSFFIWFVISYGREISLNAETIKLTKAAAICRVKLMKGKHRLIFAYEVAFFCGFACALALTV